MLSTISVPVPPPSQLLLCVAIALFGYVTILGIYRVFFHPLAKYPSPLSYKLSGWPLLWQAYTGDRHIWHLLDHEKYGPIVRISPNTLSFNTSAALHTIYATRSTNAIKGPWYETFDIAAGTYSSFTETDREKHAVKRRWMSPAFAAESLRENEPRVIEIIERFCEGLRPEGKKGGWGRAWNASKTAVYLGFDIMGALVFGCDFKTVQEEENRGLANSVLPAQKLLYWISYLPVAFLVRPFLRSRLFEMMGGKAVRDNNRLIDYGKAQVRARLADHEGDEKGLSNRIDFLSKLVENGDKKTDWHPTALDLDTESLNMILAGADPYSQVLAGTFFYLVHNPECLQKVTQEIRSTFTTPSEITSGPKLNSCVYLHATIEETLRLTSPIPSHLPRTILPGGLTIDTHPLPARTTVGVSQYALHHNPVYHPDPFTFSPSRWLISDANPQSAVDEARRAFAPFGLGARQCVGMKLGYLQLKLTLAHFLWRFDVRECAAEKGVGCGRRGMGVGREREGEWQLWDALGAVRDGPVVEARWAH